MLTILARYMTDASPLAFAVLFLGLFLIIVGGSLWLTPRIARWLDRKDKENKSYYDGMLEKDPNQPEDEADAGEKEAEEDHV